MIGRVKAVEPVLDCSQLLSGERPHDISGHPGFLVELGRLDPLKLFERRTMNVLASPQTRFALVREQMIETLIADLRRPEGL